LEIYTNGPRRFQTRAESGEMVERDPLSLDGHKLLSRFPSPTIHQRWNKGRGCKVGINLCGSQKDEKTGRKTVIRQPPPEKKRCNSTRGP